MPDPVGQRPQTDAIGEEEARRDEGSVLAEISRNIVKLYAHLYGRGPTKAKTIWREEIVVCVLRDVFTKSERLLLDDGRFELVRQQRTIIQNQAESLLRRAVELPTGHYVETVLSPIGADGVTAEVFILGAHAGPLDTPIAA